MQKTFRIHLPRPSFSDPGTESADFTGEHYIGQEQGDHHATIVEFPVSDEDAVELEILARRINRESVKELAPGVFVGARAGIWDDVAPR